jgi:hypothetical protein
VSQKLHSQSLQPYPRAYLTYSFYRAYTHDPDTYHEPLLFKPERFLGEKPELDPETYVWGFGRRVCPGRVLADYSIWLNVATVLACFSISRKAGSTLPTGLQASEAKAEYFVAGTISHPAPFEVDVQARSKQHLELIKHVEVEYPFGENNAQELRDRISSRRADVSKEKHGHV